MIVIGYAKNHARDCYYMYNPITWYVIETRDIISLYCMYFGKPEARDEVVVYPQVVLPLELEDAEAREGMTLNAAEPKIESKEDEKERSTVHKR